MPSGRGSRDLNAAGQMIAYVRGLIEKGTLRPGDRLAPQRELAHQIGVSRSSIREGQRSLAAMGVVTTRQGSGAFITAGPAALPSEPLGLLAALHGISRGGLFEARRALEASTAALAAGRATGDQLAAISNEITRMPTAPADPEAFLVHDIRFHRAVAAGANNFVLGVLIDMVASLHYEQRRATIERARDRLREAADMHRCIYQAIRTRDVEGAGCVTWRVRPASGAMIPP
jgi:GntR family transcriptional repressor for pyruvate dehydrogenase complex